ncbi:MAG: SufE family protein [Rickettsiales bacterium]|jgi:sulfur transfer protein SufE|nr:SufE family protein [Rickettsiales bacterium]
MKYDEMKSLLDSAADPVSKLEMLMELGRFLLPIPPGKAGSEIKGCASKVEIFRDAGGRLCAAADSEMVRGIVALLIAMKEAGADFSEFPAMGLPLGAGRLNGTAAMIEYLKNM